MNHLQDFLTELRANGYEPVRDLRIGSPTWERLMFNGEKAGKASGGYKLIQNPDGSLFANYGSSKDKSGNRSWRSDKTREYTYEEMVIANNARAAHRKEMQIQEQKRHELIGVRLSRALKNYPLAKTHPYLTDKKIEGHGAKIRPKTGELLIPRYSGDKKIMGLQRIKQARGGEKSWKGYFKGAMSKDLFYPMFAANEKKEVILLCEGFATGASLREATGYPVVVCFDSGGLAGVSRVIKKLYPSARIVFAADNDQWTFANGKKPDGATDAEGDDPRWQEWREAGLMYNTGSDKAQKAAAGIGGAIVLLPDFEVTHPKKYTDFNDLVNEKGGEYVKMMFEKVLEIPRATVEEPSGGVFVDSFQPDVQASAAGDIFEKKRGDMGMAFRILGYNEGHYYYFPHRLKQIVSLTAAGHTMQNLLQLDELDAWERPYRSSDGKLTQRHQGIALLAANQMMILAKQRGIFVEESSVRGCGAWIDEGRIILHCGDRIYCEGRLVEFDDIESEYTYVAAKKLMRPARTPLDNYEARRLRTICEAVTWENKLSGTLLSGWLVIAPICAALTYRPHIYLTGEAESGKSTVMDRIVKPVLGKIAVCVDGGTTEPAVRDLMAYDGRPLVYDEAEPSASMGEVILLARKATTGAVVKKFGQKSFKARFCACFSAINPPVNKTADESRISFMHIKKNRRPTAMQEFEDLIALIEETITDDFAERMIARTLENMENLIANIRTFQRAVRQTVRGARASQQIGTMLAGTYLLGSTSKISDEAALEIAKKFDWHDHTIIDQDGDPIRLVQHIVSALLRTRAGTEASVGELVMQARGADLGMAEMADKMLRNYGIAVKGDRVLIASRSQNLARILKDTEWHDKWSRTLSDVAGAEKISFAYFSTGVRTSAIGLPISMFIDEEPPAQAALDDDGW